MSKKYLVLIILSIVIVSCNNTNDPPKNLIPHDKMALIITDLTLLEATYNTKLIRIDNKKELMQKYSNEIFEKHQVTEDTFDKSYDYYINNSEEFELILELVFEELNKMETQSAGTTEVIEGVDSTITSE